MQEVSRHLLQPQLSVFFLLCYFSSAVPQLATAAPHSPAYNSRTTTNQTKCSLRVKSTSSSAAVMEGRIEE